MPTYLRAALPALALLLSTTSVSALDKLSTPYVTKGELALEYSGTRTRDSDTSKDNIQKHGLEIGYSATDYWQVEIGGSFAHDAGGPTIVKDIEVENKFQFFEPGDMWVDTGVLFAYSHALHSGDADAIEVKFLAQKNFGKIVSLANLGFEQGMGSNNHGGPDVTFNWNNRYRLADYFQPGIELQSDLGQTNMRKDFEDHEQFIGPAVFGTLFSGSEHGAIKYEAAYLFGMTDVSPSSAGRLLIEYKKHF